MQHRALERAEERVVGLDRHRADGAAGHQEAEDVDRIGRIGNDDDVAGRGDRLRDVGEAFLGAERGDDLRFGIELDAEAARIIGRLRAAQPGYALGGRITVGARLADGLLQLLDDMRGRRQIGIAHAEIDDVGAAVAGHRLGAVDLLEHVGRQAANAIKFFHGNPGASSRSNTTLKADFYHLVSAPAVCAPLPHARYSAGTVGGGRLLLGSTVHAEPPDGRAPPCASALK